MEKGNLDTNRINIFIVDNSDDNKQKIENYFSKKENYNIVGFTKNGQEAFEQIKNSNIDVIIMDMVLSNIDGFELLEQLVTEMGRKMPKIIVTSHLTHSGFIDKALSLGVSYFMIKPVDMECLDKRIQDILGISNVQLTDKTNFKNMKTRVLEEKISNIFMTVGIPAHIKGYHFLREAIKLAISKPEIINSITKQLYPNIAEKFNTSASKVERAIRHAIEVAWNRGKIENINSVFGIKIYNPNEKPTNGEFIALVADKMLLEGIE